MVCIDGGEAESKALLMVSEIMIASARTAPKARGLDSVHTMIVVGEEKERIAEEMKHLAETIPFEERRRIFRRDANSVLESSLIVLVGVKGSRSKGWNCGACGYSTCAEFDEAEKVKVGLYGGPNCAPYLLDLGVALGSAAKIASDLNVDNRIMYTAGAAAKQMGIMKEPDVVVGIAVAATGKNIFFDRFI